MIHELFLSASDFCPSLIFNNPGKIMDACFRSGNYEDPIYNPCTVAIGGLFFGAITDGASSSTGGSDYYDSGSTDSTAPTGGTSEPAPETSLSDFLPSEYREPNLSDVVD